MTSVVMSMPGTIKECSNAFKPNEMVHIPNTREFYSRYFSEYSKIYQNLSDELNSSIDRSVMSPIAKENDRKDVLELDIIINNVVSRFNVNCELNLRNIAISCHNTEQRRDTGDVIMRLRNPNTTARIWQTGHIMCVGASSEEMAKLSARRYARCLQKLGYKVRFGNYTVVNILATCRLPFRIHLVNFAKQHKSCISYEPEFHPGVIYRMTEPRATLRIYSTGSLAVASNNVEAVETAIVNIFPLVYQFRSEEPIFKIPKCDRREEFIRHRPFGKADNDPKVDLMIVSDFEETDNEL